MNSRQTTILGLLAIACQYLLLSESANAQLLPELGVVVLIIAGSRIRPVNLLTIALIFGYFGDVIGAPSRGLLLASYVAAAAVIIAIRHASKLPITQNLRPLVSLFSAFVAFHGVNALAGGGALWALWLPTVLIASLGTLTMVVLTTMLHRVWERA